MKILSFGEIIRDVYPDSSVIGGAPLNFCAHCVKCGAEGYMLSAVGNDSAGESVLRELEYLGVNTELVQRNDKETGACIVTLDGKGIPSYRVLTNVAYDFISFDSKTEKAISDGNFDAFCFGTLAQRNPISRSTLKEILKHSDFKTIFCDINLRDGCYDAESVRNCLENATILKLSDEEEPRLSRLDFWSFLGEKSFSEKAGLLFDRYLNLDTIIFTKGKKGAEIYRREEPAAFIDAQKAELVSTVGAGDSFGAVYLSMILSGVSPRQAGETAAKVSAFVVSQKEAIPKYDISDFR